jgi:tetratricopeptide (TPR) repeat protein
MFEKMIRGMYPVGIKFYRKLFAPFIILIIVCMTSASNFTCHTDYIRNGDYYFTIMRYPEAIAWYRLDSTKAEAHWKIARAYICYADNAPKNEKEINFRKAEKAAQKCIQLNELNSNGHTWKAAAMGNIAMYEGSKMKVKLCNEIKRELLRAIQLNPKDDLAHSILGTLYREIGNISWLEKELALAFIGKIPDGGFQESKNALNQAVSINPSIMRHWFELGLLYKSWDKKELAIAALHKAKNCPVLIASDHAKLIKINTLLESI